MTLQDPHKPLVDTVDDECLFSLGGVLIMGAVIVYFILFADIVP